MTYRNALWLTWAAIVGGFIGFAYAQTGPQVIPGCIYNVTPPTLSNKQQTTLQCDVNGKLKVTTS